MILVRVCTCTHLDIAVITHVIVIEIRASGKRSFTHVTLVIPVRIHAISKLAVFIAAFGAICLYQAGRSSTDVIDHVNVFLCNQNLVAHRAMLSFRLSELRASRIYRRINHLCMPFCGGMLSKGKGLICAIIVYCVDVLILTGLHTGRSGRKNVIILRQLRKLNRLPKIKTTDTFLDQKTGRILGGKLLGQPYSVVHMSISRFRRCGDGKEACQYHAGQHSKRHQHEQSPFVSCSEYVFHNRFPFCLRHPRHGHQRLHFQGFIRVLFACFVGLYAKT